MNGQLQLHLEQRKPTELDEVEAAAVITALWDIANTLEEDQLDRPVDEVLTEADYEQQLNTDKGRSVE